MKIGVIILNYFSYQDTIRLYESLVQSEDCKVLVLDNSSDRTEFNALEKKVDPLSLIYVLTNTGYAGGNNIGINHFLQDEEVDVITILNPDIDTQPEVLTNLAKQIRSDKSIGCLGPRLTVRNTDLVYSDGGKISEGKTITVCHRNSNIKINDVGLLGTNEVDYVNGSFLVTRKDVIAAMVSFEENYFLYYEETAWCYQLAQKGYKVMINSNLSASQSISPKGTNYKYYMTRNHLLFSKAISYSTFKNQVIRNIRLVIKRLLLCLIRRSDFKSLIILIEGTISGLLGISGKRRPLLSIVKSSLLKARFNYLL